MNTKLTRKALSRAFTQTQIFLGVAVVALVIAASVFFLRPSPKHTPVEVPPETSSKSGVVEIVQVEKGNRPITIEAYGTVQPHRKLTVLAEVKGRIIEQSPNLDAGGILKEGDVLLKIDPTDYIDAVEQARAQVENAEFNLVLEKGKKVIAEKEWELIDPTIKQGGIGKNLALRIPHVREKESALQASMSKLEKALVDLKRTVLRAPFNALVLEEFVEIGQVLSPQSQVATLISTDEYRILISIPYDELPWIKIPQNNEKEGGTRVTIIQEIGEGKTLKREGSVFRLMGNLDPNGRLAQVLVVVKDPLGLEHKEAREKEIPLLIGTHVKVEIEGPVLENVFQVPSSAIRDGNKVWIRNSKGRLEIHEVKVLSINKEKAIVDDSLNDGDEVVISSLPVAIQGMELRI